MGKAQTCQGRSMIAKFRGAILNNRLKGWKLKTEQNKAPHHPGCLGEPFTLINTASQGHWRADAGDDTTQQAVTPPTTPQGANYFPGLILPFTRQFQQPCRRGHSQKQELLDGRHTYWFLGAGRWAKAHTSSCPRKRHQPCCCPPGALVVWGFGLDSEKNKTKPMFSIVRGLSKNGEHTVSETRNPGRVAASDACVPVSLSHCPTQTKGPRSCCQAPSTPASSGQHSAPCWGLGGAAERTWSEGSIKAATVWQGWANPPGTGDHQTVSGISA